MKDCYIKGENLIAIFSKGILEKLLYFTENKMGKQYYDEPKYDLMKKFIQFDMKLQKGETFTKNYFIKKFKEKYPEFKDSGIEMSLSRLSVNDPNRERYNPSERDDFLWKIDGHTFILYDEKTNTKKPKLILIKKKV